MKIFLLLVLFISGCASSTWIPSDDFSIDEETLVVEKIESLKKKNGNHVDVYLAREKIVSLKHLKSNINFLCMLPSRIGWRDFVIVNNSRFITDDPYRSILQDNLDRNEKMKYGYQINEVNSSFIASWSVNGRKLLFKGRAISRIERNKMGFQCLS